MPSMVFPQPGPPQTIVVRPRGNPPPLISSSPLIPVGALGNEFAGDSEFKGYSKSNDFERLGKAAPDSTRVITAVSDLDLLRTVPFVVIEAVYDPACKYSPERRYTDKFL
jgi:hypothetical protein